MGHRAHLYAELAGRIEANFNDVRLTFEEMGLELNDLLHYSSTLDEAPFPKGTQAARSQEVALLWIPKW